MEIEHQKIHEAFIGFHALIKMNLSHGVHVPPASLFTTVDC